MGKRVHLACSKAAGCLHPRRSQRFAQIAPGDELPIVPRLAVSFSVNTRVAEVQFWSVPSGLFLGKQTAMAFSDWFTLRVP